MTTGPGRALMIWPRTPKSPSTLSSDVRGFLDRFLARREPVGGLRQRPAAPAREADSRRSSAWRGFLRRGLAAAALIGMLRSSSSSSSSSSVVLGRAVDRRGATRARQPSAAARGAARACRGDAAASGASPAACKRALKLSSGVHQPAERDRGALLVVVLGARGFARPALVELDVATDRDSRSRWRRRPRRARRRRTPRRSQAAQCRSAGRAPASGRRSMASPMTPPRPVGSGQCALFGRQATKPAPNTVPASQNDSRIHSRSNGRWVAMRQPQTATGSTSTVEARPNNCISRSAPMAPGVPR